MEYYVIRNREDEKQGQIFVFPVHLEAFYQIPFTLHLPLFLLLQELDMKQLNKARTSTEPSQVVLTFDRGA